MRFTDIETIWIITFFKYQTLRLKKCCMYVIWPSSILNIILVAFGIFPAKMFNCLSLAQGQHNSTDFKVVTSEPTPPIPQVYCLEQDSSSSPSLTLGNTFLPFNCCPVKIHLHDMECSSSRQPFLILPWEQYNSRYIPPSHHIPLS